MKPSKYNIFFKHKGQEFAFNGMSCALAEITDDFKNIIRSLETLDETNLNEDTKELLNLMKEGKYIIDDNDDELSILKYKNYGGKFRSNTLGLTIAPTLACNFACPYCYEHTRNEFMDDDTKNAIYSQVEMAAKRNENVDIAWYGGEPTLAKDIIVEMSKKMIKICEKNGVKYEAGLTSNCFLLDDKFVKNMLNLKITMAQATLDGPPATHNLTRILKTGEGTFDTIIDNAKKMKANGVDVQFRVNIAKFNNSCNFEELLDILIANGFGGCDVRIGQIVEYSDKCSKIAGQCFSNKEMATEFAKYYKLLVKKGFMLNSRAKQAYFPRLKAHFCGADNNNSFVIDPSGNLYKCWVEIGEIAHSFGNIKDFKNMKIISTHKENIEYITWSPFDHKECLECTALPFCMGGCPHEAKKKNGKPDCINFKYNLVDMLKIYCDQVANV